MPPVVVHLGELVGLIYRSDKGQARNPRHLHPLHGGSAAPGEQHSRGTQLYLVGGSYGVFGARHRRLMYENGKSRVVQLRMRRDRRFQGKGSQLGLDELMIVNPGPPGTRRFLGEDGTLYQVQGLGDEV